MMNQYQTDNLESLYNQLAGIDLALDKLSKDMPQASDEAINCAADYENAKNQTLVMLYKDEKDNPQNKRTEKQREVIYRTKHKDLRLLRELGKQTIQTNRDYLELLKTRQMNLQTRINLLKQG